MSDPTTLVPIHDVGPPVVIGAGMTHVGRVREANEDSILTDPSGVLWAVADGMGGHGNGDVASDLVIERLLDIKDTGPPDTMLVSLIQAANAEIFAEARARGGGTMGATVVTAMVQGAIAYIAWAGDSRAYLCRNGGSRLLTKDHTMVQELLDGGMIDAEGANTHHHRNVVTRAVGAAPDLDVDVTTVPLVHGDRLILCSDGLTDCLGDGAIGDLVVGAATPDAACTALVSATLQAGAPDNVSVIVLFVQEG